MYYLVGESSPEINTVGDIHGLVRAKTEGVYFSPAARDFLRPRFVAVRRNRLIRGMRDEKFIGLTPRRDRRVSFYGREGSAARTSSPVNALNSAVLSWPRYEVADGGNISYVAPRFPDPKVEEIVSRSPVL